LTNTINIKIKQVNILYNKTTEKNTEDKFAANLYYVVEVKNISNEKHNIDLKLFIQNSLSTKIVIGDRTFGPKGTPFSLQKGEKIVIDYGPLIKHPDTLDKETKTILYNYMNELVAQVDVDSKLYTILIKK
jgi:hypothetical protein